MALASTARGTGTLTTSNTTFVFTPASYPAATSLLVFVIAHNNSGTSGAAPTTSITDSKSNTWVRQHQTRRSPGNAANDGSILEIWTTRQDKGVLVSANTITVTYGTATASKTGALWEVTAASGYYAQYLTTGTGAGGASTAPSVTTGTIVVGDMVIGGVAYEYGQVPATSDTDTTNGSWSTRQNANIGSTTSGMSVCTQTKVQTTADSTQTYNPTYTTSSDWAAGWISIDEAALDLSYAQANAQIKAIAVEGFAQAGAFIPYSVGFDTFTRTVSPGFGTADQGGTWVDNATGVSTNGSVGQLSSNAGNTRRGYMAQTHRQDVRVRTIISTDKLSATADAEVHITARQIDLENTYYYATVFLNIDQSISVSLFRKIAGSPATVTGGGETVVSGLTHGISTQYHVIFEVIGTSTATLRVKVWQVGTNEPAAWSLTGTDTSAELNIDGGGGMRFYNPASSTAGIIIASFDDFSINAIPVITNTFAQAQVSIAPSIVTRNTFAQAQADIEQAYTRAAQANTYIKIIGIEQFSQAQVDIKQNYQSYAQANTWIKTTALRSAQAQAFVMKLVWFDSFTRTLTGESGSPNIGSIYYDTSADKPDITGSAYAEPATTDIISEIGITGITTAIIQFDIFTQAQFTGNGSIGVTSSSPSGYRLAFDNTEGWAVYIFGASTYGIQAFSPGDSEWWTLKGYISSTDIKVKVWKTGTQEPNWLQEVTSTEGIIASSAIRINSNASIVGMLIDNLSILTVDQPIYTTVAVAQAQVAIVAAVTMDIEAFAQSQTSIKQIYREFAQATTWIKTPNKTNYAQTQGYIKVTDIERFAQAQADIKAVYQGFSQAQVDIKAKGNSFAQSQADIKQAYQAFAQVTTWIETTSYSFAQTQVDIKTTYVQSANVQTSIKQIYQSFAQAQSRIKQTYRGYAQAQADIKQAYQGFAQAQTTIKQAYQAYAQAQVYIKLSGSVVFAQAQTSILRYYQAVAQVQAHIKIVGSKGFAQAQVTIKTTSKQFAQAMALIYIPQYARPIADISNNGWIRVVI